MTTKTKLRGWSWVLVLFAGLLAGVLLAPLREQPVQAQAAEVPADLALVPANALGFVRVRLADLLQTPLVQEIEKQLAPQAAQARQTAAKLLGVAAEDIEVVTAIVTTPKPGLPLLVVTTRRPLEQKKVLDAALPSAQEHTLKDQKYYTSPQAGRNSIRFLTDRLFVFGPVEDVVQQIARPAKADGARPLAAGLELAAQRHLITAAARVPEEMTLLAKRAFQQNRNVDRPEDLLVLAFKPLLDVRATAFALDLGQQMDLQGQFVFANEKEAQEAVWPVRDGLGLARLLLSALIEKTHKDRTGEKFLPLLTQAQTGLHSANVQQQGPSVRVTLRLPFDPAVVLRTMPAALAALDKVRSSSDRMQSTNNLKQIALAMHNYHDTYGSFPPHAIYAKDGTPLLSWRVAILPFLEQNNLYKQFKLDEPWDSAHNKALAKVMPRTYITPRQIDMLERTKGPKAPLERTHYQVFVGKMAGFEGKKGVSLVAITDGTSNTLLVVEAAEPVLWTKPDDLPYDAKQPLPKLGRIYPGGFLAAFCDGSVHFLKDEIKEETLRALITRNGGEVINSNDF